MKQICKQTETAEGKTEKEGQQEEKSTKILSGCLL